MGVDIYGIKDKWVGIKPELDWTKEHSEEAKEEFWKLLDEFENTNPGYYFRSNWWGWRPIIMLSQIAAQNADLDICFKHWGSNDGKGLENQEECTALAEALEQLLAADGSFEHESDELYVNMGSWRDGSGMVVPEHIQDILNNELPYGKVTFTGIMITTPIVEEEDEVNLFSAPSSVKHKKKEPKIYYPSHSCDKAHVDRFIAFLRECGGFTIW